MTARRAALLALAAAIVGCSNAWIGPRPAAFADEAPTNSVSEAQRLAEEAKEFEKTAGDGDADQTERKAARKAAFERLKKAQNLLDAWLDQHPADQDRLDAVYCDIASRIFWIKKMAGVDEFTDRGGAPPSAGGSPPAEKPPGVGPAPTKPPVEAPVKPAPPTAAETLAAIEAYEAKHKSDVPGLYERYQDLLAKYPDPATPEYAKAMSQVAALGKRLKDVYRVVHDDDPDSVKNVDSAQTEKLLPQLVEDLDKGAPEVRERAAKYLGSLGSGKAADPLVRALKKEKAGPVFDAAADALAKIGGRRVCDRLMKAGGDPALSGAVVDVLQKILARGGAEGRVAGEALGGYVEAVEPDKRGPLFDALSAAGPVGALGLARALPFAPPAETSKFIQTLPDAGDPRVTTYLAKFLVLNAPGDGAEFSKAARESIKKIGKPAVRYLIPALDDAAVSVWTAKLLQDLTGQKLKDDKRKTWQAWFQMHRKEVEGR